MSAPTASPFSIQPERPAMTTTIPRPTVSSTGAHEVVVKDGTEIVATVIRDGKWIARYRNALGSGHPFIFFGAYDTKDQAIESVWGHHLAVVAEQAEIAAAAGPHRVADDNAGFRMTSDGMIFHHGRFIGRIIHRESFLPGDGDAVYPPRHEYVAQGIEIRTPGSYLTEFRSIASETKAPLTRAEVIEIEVANR